jgi:hypothetical protein
VRVPISEETELSARQVSNMKKVAITQVVAGQVVARPVVSNSGTVMMQPGAVLTADIAARLMDIGVGQVWVEGVPEDAKPLEVTLAELDRRFAGHEEDPLMMDLKSIVIGCIARAEAGPRD